jgi:hypothetical protein
MDEHESGQARKRQDEFARRAAAAAREASGPEPTEEEIVEAMKAMREEIYRERLEAEDVLDSETMADPELDLKRIEYDALNSRQRENYNFQKISAVLADYGFKTMRLSDDWQGADFIAYHNDGERFLKVQLKGRLWVDTKYKGKDIWICFRHKGTWYIYPHDAALRWALANKGISQTKGWEHCADWERVSGAYSWPHPPEDFLRWLHKYALRD